MDGIHRTVGEVVFRVPGRAHECRLKAEEEKLGALTVTFHDETNGAAPPGQTADWRKLSLPRPRTDSSGNATVVLDFNRAINYPSAFTPYGTCPMPVRNNSLDVRVEAGGGMKMQKRQLAQMDLQVGAIGIESYREQAGLDHRLEDQRIESQMLKQARTMGPAMPGQEEQGQPGGEKKPEQGPPGQ